MRYLPPDDSNVKPAARSAEATATPCPNEPDFATRAAQAELGRAYARPELDGFRDRSPCAIAILRAAGWLGNMR